MPPAFGPAPEPKRSWFARHKILTGIGAFIAVGMIASALNGGGGSGNSSPTAATLPSIQSMASAPAQATAGQDSAAAPSPQQQEAAKAFVNWLVYSDNGQKMLVEDAAVIPACKNNTNEALDPLGKDMQAKMSAGNT